MNARKSVVPWLAFMSVVVGCSGEAFAPPGSVGPESLTVAFQPFPDTARAGGSVTVFATSRNATTRVASGRWEEGLCGLTVRVYYNSTDPVASSPPVCRGSGTWTMAPGESTSTGIIIGLSGWPRGTYRVRAQVEAVDGRSPAIERTVVLP